MKDIAEFRLLPGALLPRRWLAGMPLDETLPAIRAALAARQLLISEVPMPSPADDEGAANAWAHDVWLSRQAGGPQQQADARQPAGSSPPGGEASRQPSAAAMAALRQLSVACQAPLPDIGGKAPAWLLRPVTFRLTTDRMLLDPEPGRQLDAVLAERLVQGIAPALAEAGHEIRLLRPDCWLLSPLPGHPGWQLHCTPIEGISDRHVDTLLPQGPDARRFRRLLNEIQMIWHQLGEESAVDLPVNGVWLSGPLAADAWQRWQQLHQQGLRVDERLLAPRADLDPEAWLAALPALDAWYRAAPDRFALLLAGERRARWLHAPGAIPAGLQPVGVRPQPVPAGTEGSWWQRLRARFGSRGPVFDRSSSPAPSPVSATHTAGATVGRPGAQTGSGGAGPGVFSAQTGQAEAMLARVFSEDD